MVDRFGITAGSEIFWFDSPESVRKRRLFVEEALTWQGTPFVNCGDVKGRKGAVDCAMLLVRSAVDTGLLPPFDPRPYPPAWHLHRDEERFIGWVRDKLGATEIDPDAVRFGDLLIYKLGRCYAHGAIVLSSQEVLHAHAGAGCTLRSLRTEPLLADLTRGGKRPVRAFTLWGD